MSRRTKLIITAIFLVLLGIPVVYVATTWNPVNPLRFRIVGQHERLTRDWGKFNWELHLDLELENTSSVPVHIVSAPIYGIPSPGQPGVYLGAVDLDATPDGYVAEPKEDSAMIPAHTIWHRSAVLQHHRAGELSTGEALVRCGWLSGIKHRSRIIREAVMQRLPQQMRDYWLITYTEHDVPLECPPHSASPASSGTP